jgi:hypothetical protein
VRGEARQGKATTNNTQILASFLTLFLREKATTYSIVVDIKAVCCPQQLEFIQMDMPPPGLAGNSADPLEAVLGYVCVCGGEIFEWRGERGGTRAMGAYPPCPRD